MIISRKVKVRTYLHQFLGINKCWSDLKNLRYSSKAVLFICMLFISISFFFNFNIIFDSSQHWFPFLNNKTLPIWRQILLPFTNITFLLAVISFILQKENKISSYFWQVMATILSGVVALSFGYVGTFQFNILLLVPIQLISFIKLTKGKWVIRNRKVVLTWYHCLLFLGFIALITTVLFFEIKFLSAFVFYIEDFNGKYIVTIIDSLTFALSIIACILMVKKIKYQWLFWILVNSLQIVMFSMIANHVNIIMILTWSIFLINGFYETYKCWK